jgi:hypothetical protein
MANWAWPEVSDEDSARTAAHMAAGWAAVVAGVTTLVSLLSLAGMFRMPGIGPSSLLDAALFGLVAWRVWNGSRAWAVAGLALYCLEIVWSVVTHPPGVGILTVLILLALINGVRGTFGLHKFLEAKKQQSMAASASGGPVAPQAPPLS